MKRPFIALSVFATILATSCHVSGKKQGYDDYPVYTGNDLELSYGPERSAFRLWAPSAEEVRLRIYDGGEGGEPVETVAMDRAEEGTWTAALSGDLKGKFYTFQIRYEGEWLAETPGIWAKAVSVNGDRAAVIDWSETDPQGWSDDRRPELKEYTDIVIYEMHHRDLSIADNSGIVHKGKYLALTEEGTVSPEGLPTGIDHLKELGVTHVHLLPSYDYGSVDETTPEKNEYNWGYDPKNYNALEGSYSTDPYDPATRIREFKQMVQSLHRNGIRVIMDVVYNHTYKRGESNFSLTVPGYFYRQGPAGGYSDASGCGNETASEREMVRRYIVESVKFWATEYHIDGFRFDLMGIHDIETMNAVRETLDGIDPSIFVYGEGWTAGGSPLPESAQALKRNGLQMPRIAVFSDDLRDALRGSWSDESVPGFASGQPGFAESIRFGVVGATAHPGVDFGQVNYSDAPFANDPGEVINYVSCHDDLSLGDKLRKSAPEGMTEQELIRFDKLAQTVVLTSQGVPFIYAGEEVFRTKGGVHNSYKSPDSVNRIDWSFKATYRDVFDYYKGLIALRKAHPAFRMSSAQEVADKLRFLDTDDPLVVAYTLDGHPNGDSWRNALVIYNGNRGEARVEIPQGEWTVVCRDGRIDLQGLGTIAGGTVVVPASSALIAYRY